MSETAERLARIETRVEAIQTDQTELRAYLTRVFERQETRLRMLEIDYARVLPRIDILRDEVGTLRKRVYVWDMVNSLAAFIAGFIGVRR